jgi:hypothetical protein
MLQFPGLALAPSPSGVHMIARLHASQQHEPYDVAVHLWRLQASRVRYAYPREGQVGAGGGLSARLAAA